MENLKKYIFTTIFWKEINYASRDVDVNASLFWTWWNKEQEYNSPPVAVVISTKNKRLIIYMPQEL